MKAKKIYIVLELYDGFFNRNMIACETEKRAKETVKELTEKAESDIMKKGIYSYRYNDIFLVPAEMEI